jgi:hypothetical protein
MDKETLEKANNLMTRKRELEKSLKIFSAKGLNYMDIAKRENQHKDYCSAFKHCLPSEMIENFKINAITYLELELVKIQKEFDDI